MKLKVGIIGGSGYTGIELLRILHQHPSAEVHAITSRALEGKKLSEVFPNMHGISNLSYLLPDDEKLFECDLVFFATPHGVAMNNASLFLDKDIKVIDLGADFRINNAEIWSNWYNMEHTQKSLLSEAVYGQPEINRSSIKDARLIANPGCYPTAVLLALKPLLEENLIDPLNIIADCKSGASGAGRNANQATLLCEITESFKPYGVSGHRHFPEIKQELESISGGPIGLTFTPHLLPMSRGIEATIYADLVDPDSDILDCFENAYKNEEFVKILPEGVYPETRSVRSSNYCQISVQYVDHSNKLVIMSVIDNLGKGAAGQAIQNMNLMFGLDENAGLLEIGLLP
ncbi:MAG: N-acetyl-gamma-glutamyl-phosphate reductase [Candidatus Pseudothioglobus sp.]|jgi:N-acetyl-gamma-glutamyl-phosphate reductase